MALMPTELDDQELVAGCLRGDRASWEIFVDRFARLVHWSIRRTLENSSFKARQDLCEDIFQEFFRKLLEREELSRLRDASSVRKFLSVGAANLALDKIKIRSRYERSSEEELASVMGDSGHEAAEREASFLVQETVEELSAKERACMELHYLEGKSHREIGEILKLPQDTVSTVIRRTREKLKQRLIEKGLDEA